MTKALQNFSYSVLWCGAALGCSIALFASCNARVEGCLDPEATNFDVTVDRNDQSSCTYPDLLLDASYRWADTVFRLNEVFVNDLSQAFVVTDAYILFSQVVLNTVDQGSLTVDNKTTWYVGDQSMGGELEVSDDFTLVDLTRFVYPLGDWSTTTFITTANLSAGVPDSLVPTIPDTLMSDKISDPRVFYSEELMRFAIARFSIISDTSTDVSNTYHITEASIPLTFELNKDLNLGSDDTVRVAIDFEQVLGTVDFGSDSTSIVQEIANGLSQAIIDNN